MRARIDGTLKTIATNLTEAVAKETADAFAVVRNEAVLREGVTLKQFGTGFLDRRERDGVRGIYSDRKSWGKHVAADPIGKLAVASLERRDVVEWLDRRKGKYGTRLKVLNLLRVALREAVERELLTTNPAREVRVHKSGDRSGADDLEGILTPPEQKALLAAVPADQRPLVVFALMTGLRQAEQWHLQTDDIGDGLIVVRRSRGGLPPKSGKNRRVHLLGPALRALELAALAARPGQVLVWPAARGGRRQDSKAPKGWLRWVRLAGITRRVRWHDLRHTCATSLLAGWWGGRKWSLDEVCTHMGHSSVKQTERYARKLAETNRLAVAATVFPASSPLMMAGAAETGKSKGADSEIRTRDLRFTNGATSSSSSARLLGGVFPRGNVEGTPSAWALALAAEAALNRRGKPFATAVHYVTVVRRGRKGVA
ncbi:MAG: tyrosine-type recombinase/integrase [Methylibium sp.]|nr:tyrosine-type recombinase/integrase [Methylibium sp.]